MLFICFATGLAWTWLLQGHICHIQSTTSHEFSHRLSEFVGDHSSFMIKGGFQSLIANTTDTHERSRNFCDLEDGLQRTFPIAYLGVEVQVYLTLVRHFGTISNNEMLSPAASW